MTLNSEIKLEKPEKHYGALYGSTPKSKLKWYTSFYTLTGLSFAIYTIALFTLPEKYSVNTFLIMVLMLVGISILAAKVFGYNINKFKSDLYDNRIKYAHTEFKTWVEQRYGAQLTEDQALSLMNGKPTEITINDEEKIVYFQDNTESSKLFNTGTPNYIRMKDIKEWEYEINENDLKLVINNKEEPSAFTNPLCEPRYE